MQTRKSINRRWLWIIAGLVLAGTVVLAAPNLLPQAGLLALVGAVQGADQGELPATVQIRDAGAVNTTIKASGAIVFDSTQPVGVEVDGTVTALPIEVGDLLAAGDLLVGLDTADLERALSRARLEVASAQNQLDQLRDPASAEEIAEAEANLASALAGLEDVQAGPTEAEVAAARASLAAAQAKYSDVTAEMSDDERTTLKANLEKARVNLERAQRAYDKIKWAGDVGATQESAELQSATIEYEAAQADYAIAAEPADAADVQSAVSSIRAAQRELDDLLSQPDAAAIASAEAQVAGAQAKLDDLRTGAGDLEVEAAEIKLQQALVSLEEALVNLRNAEVKAPVAGVVTAIETEVGATVRAGTAVVTLADPQELAVEVEVAEVDVTRLAQGQPATVSLDALPGRSIDAVVARIAPASTAGTGAVNYQVDIKLTAADLAGVRPGMTAVASMAGGTETGGWLVPVNAVKEEEGRTLITVLRGDVPVDIPVQVGELQGEWQVVTAQALQVGDQVVGSVTSMLDSDEGLLGGGGFPPRPSRLQP